MIISTFNFRSGLPDLPGWRLVLLEVLQKEKSRGGEKEEEKEISSGSRGEYTDIINTNTNTKTKRKKSQVDLEVNTKISYHQSILGFVDMNLIQQCISVI